MPAGVVGAAHIVPHRRTFNPYRTNDILRAVDIRITNHLYVELRGLCLCYEGSYILVDISCQTSLDQVHVAITLLSLQHAQIVHVAVVVEIEVVDHVLGRVEQPFKLAYSTRLSEDSSYCLQVQIVRQIGCQRGHLYGRGSSRFGRSCHNGSGLDRLVDYDGSSCRSLLTHNDCLCRLWRGLLDIDGLSRCSRYDAYRKAGSQPCCED